MNRWAYIIRRVLLLFPTLFAIYTLTFFLMHATPGGPWSQGDKPVPPLVLKRLNEAYGLDEPLWKQYFTYLGNILQGEFGPSFSSRSRTVTDIIGESFPVSIQLGLVAMAIALLIGIPLGVLGAVKHNSVLDYVSGFVAIFGVSTPSYVTVSLLVLLFANTFHLVPTGGGGGMVWQAARSSSPRSRWRSIPRPSWPVTRVRACLTCSQPITSVPPARRDSMSGW